MIVTLFLCLPLAAAPAVAFPRQFGGEEIHEGVALGPPKRGLVNLRFIIFLDFPCIRINLLVWDSGVIPSKTLFMEIDVKLWALSTVGLLTPLFGSTDSPG